MGHDANVRHLMHGPARQSGSCVGSIEELFIFLSKMCLMRKEFRSLISLEEALSIVQSHLPRAAEESVPLPEARGRILAEKVVSSLDVPGFSRASMDGFAVQAEDTLTAREDRPVCLRLTGSVPMGVLPHCAWPRARLRRFLPAP